MKWSLRFLEGCSTLPSIDLSMADLPVCLHTLSGMFFCYSLFFTQSLVCVFGRLPATLALTVNLLDLKFDHPRASVGRCFPMSSPIFYASWGDSGVTTSSSSKKVILLHHHICCLPHAASRPRFLQRKSTSSCWKNIHHEETTWAFLRNEWTHIYDAEQKYLWIVEWVYTLNGASVFEVFLF